MLIALTHMVSPRISECELSFRHREPIDLDRAVGQHQAYCAWLEMLDYKVIELTANRDFPDCTFIEDTAVVVDEIAVMARPGAASRRGEVPAVEAALSEYRKIARIEAPATLEGGDVLQVDRQLFVGLSQRTNREGVDALQKILRPYDYEVVPVPLKGCLHLKSACVALDDETLLANTDCLDLKPFKQFKIVPLPPEEPEAANALRIESIICLPMGFDQTIERIRSLGYFVMSLDISELMKAESGLTCSSILFTA